MVYECFPTFKIISLLLHNSMPHKTIWYGWKFISSVYILKVWHVLRMNLYWNMYNSPAPHSVTSRTCGGSKNCNTKQASKIGKHIAICWQFAFSSLAKNSQGNITHYNFFSLLVLCVTCPPFFIFKIKL